MQNMCGADAWVRQRCRSTCGLCAACKASAQASAAEPVGECHLLSWPDGLAPALKPSNEWDVHAITRAWAPIPWSKALGPVVSGPPSMVELAELLDRVVRENHIIYFAVNGQFLSLLDNILCSLRRLKLYNYLVLALDQPAEEYCRARGYTVWRYPSNGQATAAGGSYIQSDGLVNDNLSDYLVLTMYKVARGHARAHARARIRAHAGSLCELVPQNPAGVRPAVSGYGHRTSARSARVHPTDVQPERSHAAPRPVPDLVSHRR
jgi:hypothetical protein